MKYVETCACGGTFEVSAWGVRDLDIENAIAGWRAFHARCSTGDDPRKGEPTKRGSA